MHLDRLRTGEGLAGLGGLGLLILLFFEWFRPEASVRLDPGNDLTGAVKASADQTVSAYVHSLAQTGWSGLGWGVVVVLLLAIIAALTVVALTVSEEPVGMAVGATVLATGLGLIAFVVLLVRLTIGQPNLGLGLGNAQVDVLAPAIAGLVCTGLIAAGGWLALADERTKAPYSAAPEVPVRPLPS